MNLRGGVINVGHVVMCALRVRHDAFCLEIFARRIRDHRNGITRIGIRMTSRLHRRATARLTV